MNNHLQYFYALVQYGSFTEAAEEMYISQSALSQHIKALEEELNVKLIERSGRKLELTPAGEYFYHHSQMVVTDYERIISETQRISDKGKENLSIGYLRSCDGLEVHHTVFEFRKRHPDLIINTFETTSNRLLELLKLGKTDIALCEGKDIDPNKYIRYPIVTVPFLIEISSCDPLSEKSCVNIDDLKYHSGIIVASGAERETELNRYKEIYGFSNRFLFADTLREARMLAVSRKGFIPMDGLGDPAYLKPSVSRVNLCEDGHPILHTYHGYWKISNDNPHIKEFVDILRSQFHVNHTE